MNEYFYAYKVIGDVETIGSGTIQAKNGFTAYKEINEEINEEKTDKEEALITSLNKI